MWLWTCSPFVFGLWMRGAAQALPRVTVVPSGRVEEALRLWVGNTYLHALCPCHILLLDFLPLKCDACEQIFCTDHIAYAQHNCTSAYKKDVQVPVCPLCNTPVPVRREEMPDIVVGEHIDRDCKSDPAQRKRKIFTNKCLKPGCKQKEMMKVICDQCHKNYCLKHRHPLDHDCSGAGHPLSKAGHAAVTRAQASSSKIVAASSSGAARPADSSSSLACARGGRAATSQPHSTSPPAVTLQNGLVSGLAWAFGVVSVPSRK
uniref:AN1-type domain-containing protein n=1 Tax=Cyanoderma ruficeps TaxID=181631 RepID=A0A8C3P3I2_9PASS